MTKTPKWAQKLLLDAMEYWETKYGEVSTLEVNWRRGTRAFWNPLRGETTRVRQEKSSGRWNRSGRITVTAGTDRTDAKLVLLHEFAHSLAPETDSHSDAFWDIAWELYRWAKLPIRYCKEREGSYRKGALAAYRRTS